TECSPLITANMSLQADKMASCGREISCCHVKIDSPDENNEGEILVQGENVMLGYFRNQEATDSALRDGWFHTGDIGRFDKDMYLYITGRIKNIIVLKNGKNIYPEEIEGYLYKIPYIKEVVVSGSGGSGGEEISIGCEIYPDLERAKTDNIEDVESVIKREISRINSEISYYKRVTTISFRDKEFDKTTSKKIKRK
ncbi:MAG: AMP-binding protein, partial [Rikenellaceae bacterium]